MKSSKTKFESLLKESGYKLLGTYTNNYTKIEIECPCGHSYMVHPKSFISGIRCTVCTVSPYSQRSKDSFLNEITKSGYTLLSQYTNSKTKVTVRCSEGHSGYEVMPYKFKQGRRCPCCMKCGYNKNKQGLFYLVRWKKDNNSFLKFGITNHVDHKKRINQQSKLTEYQPEEIKVQFYIDGSFPPILEKCVHSNIQTGIIDKSVFGDGFSETVKDTPENEAFIIKLINESLLQNIA